MTVMGRPPKEWPNRAEQFAAHPHVLVTASSHPIAQAESVPAAALAREGFIVREPGSGTRAALEYLAGHHLQPGVPLISVQKVTVPIASNGAALVL